MEIGFICWSQTDSHDGILFENSTNPSFFDVFEELKN